jgi:hypothetical protein
MKKNRHTDEQIVKILREADQTSVVEAARKNSVTDPDHLPMATTVRRHEG